MELVLSSAGRRYGALRSVPDARDFEISSFPNLVNATEPIVSLRSFCGPIRDQGQKGSCTGHAGYAMRMLLANKYQGNANKIIFSPEEIYDQARVLDGTISQGDTGSTGRTIVRVLNLFGACPESFDPYIDQNIGVAPSSEILAAAAPYKAGAYHRLIDVNDMRSCIASGYGFIVGFSVYDSFESDKTAATGLMPVPKSNEGQLGGHEVFFMGYDDTVQCPNASFKGAFEVQNSWNTGWGRGGFFYFPYQCVTNGILMDAFIQHLGSAW